MLNLALVGSSDAHMAQQVDGLLVQIPAEPRGFRTEKLPPDAQDRELTYLHPIGQPLQYSDENWIGICCRRHAEKRPAVFDAFGTAVLRAIPAGSLVVMDQLGTMESHALAFQQQVLSMLDGRFAVLACIRDKDTPFLSTLRAHPGFLTVSMDQLHTAQAQTALQRFIAQFQVD